MAMAALICLGLEPESLVEPGFQMSFGATAALIVGFDWLRRPLERLPKIARPVAMAVLSSVVAGTATTPIAAAHFNRIAEYGLVANLLSIPVMGFLVMPFGVLSALLAPLGLAPEPLAKGSGWLAWRHLPGQSWQGEGGVSKLLQQLAQVPVFPGLSQRPMGAAAIAQHATSFAPAGLPALPAPVEVALPRPSLLHGDFVPGNILATPGGLRLIDWQCPGLGDPVDDLALFLSPAMQFLYRGRPLASAEIEALMLDLPGDLRARYAVLRPILHWRIAAHCALRAARGDGDYDAALRLELAGL